jgi:hypothetical protein
VAQSRAIKRNEGATVRLDDIACGLADGIAAADGKRPVAVGARSGREYAAGIGPHTESQTLTLALAELAGRAGWQEVAREVAYPGVRRSACDICFGEQPNWQWCMEVKMLRLMGDNGKPNDNMLMHILSPYPVHRSALTDCEKLVASEFQGEKAIVIFGYDYPALPMDPAIEAFETLARCRVSLGERHTAAFGDLVHPVHSTGRVFAWSLSDRRG